MKSMPEVTDVHEQMRTQLVAGLRASYAVPAAASSVNRTRRVVRERATQIAARRTRLRSLFIPVAICCSLLLILASAVWGALEQYDLTSFGLPDANGQSFVLLVWFLPVSAGILAIVWFKRMRRGPDDRGGDFDSEVRR